MKRVLIITVLIVLILGAIGCSQTQTPTPKPVPPVAPKPALAPSPAKFTVTNFTVTPLIAKSNETITITAEVINEGGTSGNYLAVLKLNDEPKAQIQIYVPAGGKEYVSWQVSGGLGDYLVSIGKVSLSYTVLPTLPAQFSTSQPSYYEQQEYETLRSQEELNKMQIEELKRQEQERFQQQQDKIWQKLEEQNRQRQESLEQQRLLEEERIRQQAMDDILKNFKSFK